jgi:NAD(P)-dependent dehydrogenase (short-subunit alcohol dehydrogenase family)
MRFEGKTVLVTGAAHGIGESTARSFAAEGANVVLVDVHERGEQVAGEIGANALFVRGDVSSEQDVTAAIDKTVERFGGLDVLVNNAAMTLPKGYLETTADEWDRVLAVNLRSTYLFLRAATPALKDSKGAVVNISSFHAGATIENFSAYAAAKSGVVGITRSAALDLAPHGVRVNAVCPGIVETAMWQAWLDEVEDVEGALAEVLKLQPLGRIGRPEEIAEAIMFLGSDKASYITGTTLFADGGVTARLSHA